MQKAWAITVDAWGNIIVAGPVLPGSFEEMFVAKLDKDGNVMWQRGLQVARASSVPPPAPDLAGAVEARDSVGPQFLDGGSPSQGGRARAVAKVLAVAALAACTVAGVAAGAQHVRAAAHVDALHQHAVQRSAILGAELAPSALDVVPATAAGATSPGAETTMALPEPSVLREETLELLNAGLPAEALPHARAYVAAAPHDATSYLFLGATLQDLGRANEAREVYNDCVKLSTTGDASECFALGGRR